MSAVRIITGCYRGRRLDPPRQPDLRPTTDFARTALFSYLSTRINWTEVRGLDLFAGTGIIGLEMLSRGAMHVTAVENNYKLVRYMQQVQQDWPVPNWEIVHADALRWLQACNATFDLIVIDPPYSRPDKAGLIKALFTAKLLNPGGIVALEHPKHETYEQLLFFCEKRTYGQVAFSFFSWIKD